MNIGFLPSHGNNTVIASVSIFFQPFSSKTLTEVVVESGCERADCIAAETAKDASKAVSNPVKRQILTFFNLITKINLAEASLK